MAGFCCDLCGKPLLVDSDVRYVVKIEVFAAYDPMELTVEELKQDRLKEIRELVRRLSEMEPRELEDQIYRSFTFDLCPQCQKKYLKDPLRKDRDAES
ncbi:MAG: hypothetical protein AMS16_04600 [Planctomycetes bacterium DG_58]|nr:MAG: hypothetical protein AMS16_04600 [Planctomycetes bacterium DG_58]KPL01432.1 MAG: hypothetical protein AMK75_05010 [Planctomycetes bacterium SM23_65]